MGFDPELIGRLAELRHRIDGLESQKGAMIRAITELPEFKQIQVALAELRDVELELETQIRDAAFAKFEEDGTLQPHPAVLVTHRHEDLNTVVYRVIIEDDLEQYIATT